jgi:hypothetical protein
LLKALGVGEVGCRRHDGGDPTGGKAGVQGGCKTKEEMKWIPVGKKKIMEKRGKKKRVGSMQTKVEKGSSGLVRANRRVPL